MARAINNCPNNNFRNDHISQTRHITREFLKAEFEVNRIMNGI